MKAETHAKLLELLASLDHQLDSANYGVARTLTSRIAHILRTNAPPNPKPTTPNPNP